jgi:hypothetical protein
MSRRTPRLARNPDVYAERAGCNGPCLRLGPLPTKNDGKLPHDAPP